MILLKEALIRKSLPYEKITRYLFADLKITKPKLLTMKIPKRVKAGALCILVLAIAGYGYYLTTETGRKMLKALRYDGIEYMESRATPPFTTVTSENSHIVFEGDTRGEIYEQYRKSLVTLVKKAEAEHNLPVNILVKENVLLANNLPDEKRANMGIIDSVSISILGATFGLEHLVVVTPEAYNLVPYTITPETGNRSSQNRGDISAAMGIGMYKFLERYKSSVHVYTGNLFYYDKSHPEVKELEKLANEAKKYGLLEKLTLSNILGIPDGAIVSLPKADDLLRLYTDLFVISLTEKQKYAAFIQRLSKDERRIAEDIMKIVERRME